MSAQLLDGKTVAGRIRSQLAERVRARAAAGRSAPALATILVGDDPASATYVRMKGKACETAGMVSVRVQLPATCTTRELLAEIAKLNTDPAIHGILLQHPSPPQIDERAAFDAIDTRKDVDGVTATGFGLTAFGAKAFGCCTPAGMVRLLDEYSLPIEGKHAVIIGRSPILGKPMAMMLLQRNATVTICHSKTAALADHVRQADIIVAAVGKPRFVKGDWVRAGAIVLDAGYTAGNIGDVDYEACAERAAWITPVPGGVGPMTIAMLLANTVDAAERYD